MPPNHSSSTGAFSMAAGEYISMQSQKELFERQIEVEREQLRIMPEEEKEERERQRGRMGRPATRFGWRRYYGSVTKSGIWS